MGYSFEDEKREKLFWNSQGMNEIYVIRPFIFTKKKMGMKMK